jgi:hypothetical protein
MIRIIRYLTIVGVLLTLSTRDLSAQRQVSSPSAAKKNTNVQKPAQKPSTVQKPSVASSPSAQKSSSNPVNKPATTKSKAASVDDKKGKSDNRSDRNISNNQVNIDKSRGDVNINVDNSKDIKVRNTKNTSVRRNNYRPYSRPPYVYGGFHYRCYNPYFYHPYRPFYWGPVWHPWGFFIATLATTAIIVSFAQADLPPMFHTDDYLVLNSELDFYRNDYQGSGPNMYRYASSTATLEKIEVDGEYFYDEGVFYLKSEGGYTVVAAPVGGVVKTIPSGYETISLDEASQVKNYYWGGTFYEKVANGYKVVPPTSGAIVEHLADGGEEVKLGEVTYVKLGETYYQPFQQNGKNMYEVVDVEKAK